jgi:hypothetical protein
LNNSCLLSHRFESGLASAFPNGDVVVSAWGVGHHVEGSALCRVLFASSASLHDLGALIFSDDTLHLQQQVICWTLAERAVQEHQLDMSKTSLARSLDAAPCRRAAE